MGELAEGSRQEGGVYEPEDEEERHRQKHIVAPDHQDGQGHDHGGHEHDKGHGDTCVHREAGL